MAYSLYDAAAPSSLAHWQASSIKPRRIVPPIRLRNRLCCWIDLTYWNSKPRQRSHSRFRLGDVETNRRNRSHISSSSESWEP
jgi:hypothetical protein